LIAASPDPKRCPEQTLKKFLSTLTVHINRFNTAALRSAGGASQKFVVERFGYNEKDVEEWFKTVDYPSETQQIPRTVLEETLE
jgi:hypothetical protein